MADENAFPKPISFTKEWHSEPYPFISPSRPELSADGKNVVITGGGTGIGHAIAVAFAKAGAKSVSILGRRPEKLKAGADTISAAASRPTTKVLYEAADLLDRKQVNSALKSIVSKTGNIDVFVSNAGSLPEMRPIVGYNAEAFGKGIVDSLLGSFNAFQEFLPLAGPEPILLNTSSCLANITPVFGTSAYAVAKAASLKMFDCLAVENPNLHVVSVQPGWVATDLNGNQKEAPDSVDLPGQFYLWLASSEAKFLKGKFVWTNWDAEELVKRAEEIKTSKLLNWVLDGVPN